MFHEQRCNLIQFKKGLSSGWSICFNDYSQVPGKAFHFRVISFVPHQLSLSPLDSTLLYSIMTMTTMVAGGTHVSTTKDQ